MPAVRSHLYDDKLDHILARAATLIAQQGYGMTSMSQVAAACSSSKARIYHYFQSKEQILFEIVSRHIDALLDKYRSAADGVTDPRERLMIVIDTVMETFAEAPDAHKVFLTELDKLPKDLFNRVISKQREILLVVKDALVEIRPETKKTGPIHYSSVAMLFLGSVNWTYTWFNHNGEMSRQQLSQYIYRLFVEGFESAKLHV